MMRIMLITHWYFGCCWAVITQSQGLFTLPCQWGAGGTQGLRGNKTGTTDPDWPKGCPILDGVMLSNESGRRWPVGGCCCCLETGWASVGLWWKMGCAALVTFILLVVGFFLFPFSFSFSFFSFSFSLLFFFFPFLIKLPWNPAQIGTGNKCQSCFCLLPTCSFHILKPLYAGAIICKATVKCVVWD